MPRLLACLSLAVILAFAASAPGHAQTARAGDEAQGDDGWRRTAHGWERTNAWVAPRIPTGGVSIDYVPPAIDASGRRFDIHPVGIVALQLALCGVAFCLFPPPRLVRLPLAD
jgi:hypothetical protein